MNSYPQKNWDIFCNVVDNFGDAGVCWRLAQQLARDYGQSIRLYCNNMELMRHFADGAPNARIRVLAWDDAATAKPADIVVEAFACELPATYVTAMTKSPTPPVWINFEYLALEAWASACHTLPSPHPQLPLTKYFFIPGMNPSTGGLLRERDLLHTRDAFLSNTYAQADFWKKYHITPPQAGQRLVTLFAYENDALPKMLEALARDTQETLCIVPEGRVTPQLAAWFGKETVAAGQFLAQGNLSVRVTGLFTQDDYDRLLWLSDLNFVRGEDSLIRALWSGKPFIWQAYPQAANAHWDKVWAMFELVTARMTADVTEPWRKATLTWNGTPLEDADWTRLFCQLPLLEKHTQKFCTASARNPDCVHELMGFVNATHG